MFSFFVAQSDSSFISKYPALFTSDENKMASCFVLVREKEIVLNKRSRRVRQYHKSKEIWQFILFVHVIVLVEFICYY